MPTLSPRERIVVGAGAAIALVVGAYLMVVEPIMARSRTAEATVPMREEMLDRRRDQIRQQARLAEELSAVNARLEAESGRLLRGPTAPLAASELQQLVKLLLGDASVEVRSERVLPASDQQGLQEVSIEIVIWEQKINKKYRDTWPLARLERANSCSREDVKIRSRRSGSRAECDHLSCRYLFRTAAAKPTAQER